MSVEVERLLINFRTIEGFKKFKQYGTARAFDEGRS